MFPYANVIVRAYMYGQQITRLFEESVSYYNDTDTPNRGEFLHVSGMRVEYDLSKPSGSRVASIYIRDTDNPQGGMAPIKNEQVYRIGMPSFIANGGSRFSSMENFALKNSTGQSTSFVIFCNHKLNFQLISAGVRDEIVLREYIKKLTPLTYGNEGRVKFISNTDNPTVCPNTNVTGTVFCECYNHFCLLLINLTNYYYFTQQ
jgi:5'-nucleotidase